MQQRSRRKNDAQVNHNFQKPLKYNYCRQKSDYKIKENSRVMVVVKSAKITNKM